MNPAQKLIVLANLPDLADVAGDTSGGLIVHDSHCLDLLVRVRLEDLLQLGLISTTTPWHLHHLHLKEQSHTLIRVHIVTCTHCAS